MVEWARLPHCRQPVESCFGLAWLLLVRKLTMLQPDNEQRLITEAGYHDYLKALLGGDRDRCRKVFESWLEARLDLRRLYQELVQRSLYDVGELWETGRISVATEHLATAITESLLNLVYPHLFRQPRLGKKAVITCAANEFHQLGGKMVADLFELNGWRGYFLGANTPLAAVLDLLRQKEPDVVALSLTVYFNLEALVSMAKAIRTSFPGLPILAGGQAFRWGGQAQVEAIPGAHCLRSLDELETWIRAHSPHVA